MNTDQPTSFGATSPDAARRLAEIFPEPTEVTRRRGRRRVRAGAASAMVLAMLGIGAAAVDSSASEAVRLRTATVGVRNVDAVLTGVATIQAVSQASVAFTSAGTVLDVSVAVGDRVVVGQQLASLDTNELEQALHEQQSVFAQAELSLANALDGTASTSSTSSTSDIPSTDSTTVDRTAAQQAVLVAQQAVDAALTASDAALDAAAPVCDTPATDGATTTTTSTTADTTTTSVAESPASGTDVTAACRTALSAVREAQRTTAAAQQALFAAAARFDELLTSAAATSTSNPSTVSTQTARAAIDPTESISSEELIALQKAVDAAVLNVLVAAQAVQRADVVAPLAGTVVAVGVTPGDTVTADSSTQAITIVSDGGMEATTTVDVARVGDIDVGQQATVVVDGTDHELDGEVVAVAVTPESGSTSYRLTVALTDEAADSAALPIGATGTVSIVTDAVTSALAVPTSAIDATADGHSVQLVDGTEVTTTEVGVGVAGDRWTEITSGLSKGQRVVLADLDEVLPGSVTTAEGSNGGSGTTGQDGPPAGAGGGQFPTGGLPTGAFPGGPPG